MSENIIKRILININNHFQEKQKLLAYKPSSENLKISRKNGFIKNLLRLSNKTMIGINRIHIFKWGILAGFFGIALGYFCNQFQYYFLAFKEQYRPTIKSAIMQHILNSNQIKDTLNKSLLQNVYKNKQVQYSLHELLDWKVIRPQQQNLFQLSKVGIIKVLKDEQLKAQCISLVAKQIQSNQSLISTATLDFLESDKLIKIVIEQISIFFRSQFFYNLLSKQIIYNVNGGMMQIENRDKLYNICRDQFLSW